ncbi:MAG: hypothetical protein ACTHJM_14155 [Marmoricola sp.]
MTTAMPRQRWAWLVDAVEAAAGHRERENAALAKSGGPAGNARLTAWLGLVLLVLFAGEGVTILRIHQLLDWHVAIGAIVIGPVVLKVASTGWRMLAYYGGLDRYRAGGPPPMLFRVLGPLVVLTSVAVVGTGVVLIFVGAQRSRESMFAFAGVRVDWLFLHQATFFLWFAVMVVHVLGRTVPSLKTARASIEMPRAVDGLALRAVSIVAALALGAGLAFWMVPKEGAWHRDFHPCDASGYRAAPRGDC